MRRLQASALSAAVILIRSTSSVAASNLPNFAMSDVPARSVLGAGYDAGIDVSTARYVRISASGTLTAKYGACGRSYVPSGCGASQGALVAAFATSNGRPLSGVTKVGEFAVLPVPGGATRLLLKVNGVTGHEVGSYHVVADAVNAATVPTLGSAEQHTGGGVQRVHFMGRVGGVPMPASVSVAPAEANASRALGSRPIVPVSGTAPTRSDVQYAMRRFGFGDSPEQVSYWYRHGGVPAWITFQLAYNAIPDTGLANYVDPMPVLTGNATIYPDDDVQPIVETRLFQQQVATQRQLLEKVTLHWLEHFAVSKYLVGSNFDMEHYVETVRADALGNFAKLVSDVAKEPAMLEWLDNNYNSGNATNPPNQNFGREVMQLYTIGLTQLNADGTPVLDATGTPVPTYSQNDVVTSSEALTGFEIHGSSTQVGSYPGLVDSVTFNPASHYNPAMHNNAPLPTIFGQTIADSTRAQCAWNGTAPAGQAASGPCVVDAFVQILAMQPTTCAFEAKEMLQRFVNENPSPAYVNRISSVWCSNVNASNQIALVVNAIATDPEFLAGKYTMVKEPIEYEVDAVRALRGAKNAVSANPIVGQTIPLSGPFNDSKSMQQEVWYPPSVFSFYYPGHKEDLLNNYEILSRWQSAANLGADVVIQPRTTQADTTLDLTGLAPAGTIATPAEVRSAVDYVLDALVDGGTPELRAIATNYMLNFTNNSSTTANNSFQQGLRGVVWLVMSSPEDEAN